MLKIDVADQAREQGITVRLEGRMVGPWVQELQRACERDGAPSSDQPCNRRPWH